MIVQGIAVPYDEMSRLTAARDRAELGPFREIWAPGAVEWDEDAFLTWTHAAEAFAPAERIPLARVGSGTMILRNTPAGLEIKARIPESAGRMREALRSGDLDGSLSVAVRGDTEDDTILGGEWPIVVVRSARLLSVAIVRRGTWDSARLRITEDS